MRIVMFPLRILINNNKIFTCLLYGYVHDRRHHSIRSDLKERAQATPSAMHNI